MAITNQKQMFVRLLSNVRHGAEQSSKIYTELSQLADEPEVREALEARAFISTKVLSTVDECFKVIGERPMEATGRLRDVFVQDFREDLAEIQSPEAKKLFVLAKAHHLNQMRIGEYAVLIEAAEAMGHPGVAVLLSACLADKIAFMERTRSLIRTAIEGRVEMRRAA